MQQKCRDVRMDLLRLVSMLLIILLHSIDHSGVLEAAEDSPGLTFFYVRFTYALCQVSVNVYVMLSGYFLVNSTFRLQKLAALWMQTSFYSFTLKAIFMAVGQEPFSWLSLVGCFFPIVTGRYWFLTIYAGMYLIFPFLNLLVNATDRKQHALLNICLFCLFSAWISIHPSFAGMNSGAGWGLPWFVVLYFAAAWIRRYYVSAGKPVRYLAVFVAVPAIIAAAQCILRENTGTLRVGVLASMIGNWFRYDASPVYLMSLMLFVGFLNIQITGKKISHCICLLSPLTLGVYLIHAHADVSPWLWEILALPEKMDSMYFPIIQLCGVLLIFLACVAVDAVRKATIGRQESGRVVMTVCNKITAGVNGFFGIGTGTE